MPRRFVSDVIVGHCAQFDDEIFIKTEIAVYVDEELAELCDFAFDLLFGTQNVRIVLHEASHAHDAVERSARLVANAVPELGKAHRKIFIASRPRFKYFDRAGAVHRLDREHALFAFGDEHIFLIMSPVSAPFPQRARHNRRRIDFHIAVGFELFSHVFLQRYIHGPAVRMPKNLTGIFVVYVEEIHLYAEFSMIALVGFFEHFEIIFQIVGLCKTGCVYAREHRLTCVSVPICARNFHQFKSLRVYLFRARNVRPAAEIAKAVLFVSGDRFVRGKVLYQIDFIRLVFEKGKRFVF